jgi:hypothetical protein
MVLAPLAARPLEANYTVSGESEIATPYSASNQTSEPPCVVAVNGEAFIVEQRPTVEIRPLKTSVPVFKAFGMNADGSRLLYSPLKNGIPSGELAVEDLATGRFEKLAPRVALEAVWSPTNASQLAFTYSRGADFAVAVLDLGTGEIKTLAAEQVYAEILQWDDSGSGLYYFEISKEGESARLSPRYTSIEAKSSEEASRGIPARFPALYRIVPKANDLTRDAGGAAGVADPFAFHAYTADGAHELIGKNLLGNSDLFVRGVRSTEQIPIGKGHLIRILNDGVIVREFSGTGSTVRFVSWDGVATNIGTIAVSYNLPIDDARVQQGGAGYPPPGDCVLTSHFGIHEFAYDMVNTETVGKHALASAAGLVVFAVSDVTCNTIDSVGCADFDPNACPPSTYLGNSLVIQHADGSFTSYNHMQLASIQVAVGSTACQGLYVGRQGHTGSTDGNLNGCGHVPGDALEPALVGGGRRRRRKCDVSNRLHLARKQQRFVDRAHVAGGWIRERSRHLCRAGQLRG